MLLVNFDGVPDFERDSPESIIRRMDVKVLYGGDPSGWQVKALTHADVEWWRSEVRKAIAG